MKKLEQSMNEALEEAEECRSEMQRLEFALRERQALEEGREEGRAKAPEELLAVGREEAWQAGFKKGREEGYVEGRIRLAANSETEGVTLILEDDINMVVGYA